MAEVVVKQLDIPVETCKALAKLNEGGLHVVTVPAVPTFPLWSRETFTTDNDDKL